MQEFRSHRASKTKTDTKQLAKDYRSGRSFSSLLSLIAKRSVVSAANYAGRSSFAKDQIFVLLPIEVISHANEVFLFFCIQPTLSAFCQHIAAWQSLWSGFHTWILYNFHKIYCVSSQSIVFW